MGTRSLIRQVAELPASQATLPTVRSVTNTWTTLATMPTAEYGARGGLRRELNKVYWPSADGQPSSTIYDIASNTWSTGATYAGTPTARRAEHTGTAISTDWAASTAVRRTPWWSTIPTNTWTSGTAAPRALCWSGYTHRAVCSTSQAALGAAPLNPGSTLPPLLCWPPWQLQPSRRRSKRHNDQRLAAARGWSSGSTGRWRAIQTWALQLRAQARRKASMRAPTSPTDLDYIYEVVELQHGSCGAGVRTSALLHGAGRQQESADRDTAGQR